MHLTYQETDGHTSPDRPSLQLALEEAFKDWRVTNYEPLEAGLTGDVFGLLLTLNAALAKALISS